MMSARAIVVSSILGLATPAAVGAQDASVLSPRVDSIFALYDKRDSPGCALAVVQNGAIVYKRGYGMSNLEHDIPITPSSIFHVASVSKQFTAMAIALLAQDGKLSLDDDIRKYLPEVPDFGKTITIRHLIHHTSGLRDQWSLLSLAGWRADDPKSEADILGLIKQQKALNFEPGDQHVYSNTGYTLMGTIVKRVSGKSLREFTMERIFQPLGMNSTHFHDDHTMIVKNRTAAYVPRPAGGYAISIPVFDNAGATSLFTTVEDLAKWSNNFDDPKVGNPELMKLMHTVGRLNDGEELPYAFAIVRGKHRGLPTAGHGGADAGYRSELLRFPDEMFAFITLCNFGPTNPGALNRQVADIYLGDRYTEKVAAREPDPVEIAIAEDRLRPLEGVWFDERTESLRRTSIKDGKLRWGATGSVVLFHIGENTFKLAGQPTTIVFRRRGTNGDLVLEERSEGARPITLTRMKPVRTDVPNSEYTGRYYSDELDVFWNVVEKDGKLVIERRRMDDVTLEPVMADAFQGLGVIRFTRDVSGRVNGFLLGQGRVRKVRFIRE